MPRHYAVAGRFLRSGGTAIKPRSHIGVSAVAVVRDQWLQRKRTFARIRIASRAADISGLIGGISNMREAITSDSPSDCDWEYSPAAGGN
jgi:hypothetical protein